MHELLYGIANQISSIAIDRSTIGWTLQNLGDIVFILDSDWFRRHSVGGYTLEKDTPEDRAATKIQAEIRGFLARKHVQQMKKEGDDAATKIQAHIRYRKRCLFLSFLSHLIL